MEASRVDGHGAVGCGKPGPGRDARSAANRIKGWPMPNTEVGHALCPWRALPNRLVHRFFIFCIYLVGWAVLTIQGRCWWAQPTLRV